MIIIKLSHKSNHLSRHIQITLRISFVHTQIIRVRTKIIRADKRDDGTPFTKKLKRCCRGCCQPIPIAGSVISIDYQLITHGIHSTRTVTHRTIK